MIFSCDIHKSNAIVPAYLPVRLDFNRDSTKVRRLPLFVYLKFQ